MPAGVRRRRQYGHVSRHALWASTAVSANLLSLFRKMWSALELLLPGQDPIVICPGYEETSAGPHSDRIVWGGRFRSKDAKTHEKDPSALQGRRSSVL